MKPYLTYRMVPWLVTLTDLYKCIALVYQHQLSFLSKCIFTVCDWTLVITAFQSINQNFLEWPK